MSASKTTEGRCEFCEKPFAKGVMKRHLTACPARIKQFEPPKSGAKTSRWWTVKVEGDGLPEYWMFVEIAGSATLLDLDEFLRDIWLECCGHMSDFKIGQVTYSGMDDDDDGFGFGFDLGLPTEPMAEARVDQVFSEGLKFSHTYDYGSTTELSLEVVGSREGKASKASVVLLARNIAPVKECVSCGKKATQICSQCCGDGDGWLCGKCGKHHECGEEMLLPIVNSPRVGVCAYGAM